MTGQSTHSDIKSGGQDHLSSAVSLLAKALTFSYLETDAVAVECRCESPSHI
jgi:hypothetical protein